MIPLSAIANLGIRQRVLLLALVPLGLITLVLSSYMITSRINYERTVLFEHSQSLLSYLAVAGEFGLFANDPETLAALAKGALQRTEISEIVFLNDLGEAVYRSGAIDIDPTSLQPRAAWPDQPSVSSLNGLWMLQAPVRLSGITVDDFADGSDSEAAVERRDHLGWVVVLVNDLEMKQRQQQFLIRGLLITLIGLSLTVWLALTIGRSITLPIQAIINTIDRLRHEQFEARVKVNSNGEIGALEEGINNLAERVQLTRMRLEDQVQEATKHLRVTLSTLQRKNDALDTAKQRAERANQAKDEFLARMSHELRTPLTSVIGFAELLWKTPLNTEQQQFSDIIRRTSALLLRLIDDILDFAKFQSDATTIEKIPFSLDECIEDILEMQTPVAAEKGVQLYFISDPQLPDQLLGDPTRIRQVIGNLFSNAVKFTERGEVSIRLSGRREGAKVALQIRVQDTGIGIAAEKLKTLFQPFAQADTSITRRFGGSGLGLVITKHLVERMGGSINLSSEPGRGTEARVELVLPVDPTSQPPCDLSGSRLLLYDQDPLGLQSMASFLKWHASADTASTLRQLFERLKDSARPLDALIIGQSQSRRNRYYQPRLVQALRQRFSGKIIQVTDTHLQPQDPKHSGPPTPWPPLCVINHPLTHRKLLQVLRDPQPNTLSQSRQTALTTTAATTSPQSTATAETTAQSLDGLQLLVAEDNNFNRLLLQKILSQAGAKIAMASNGEQALALARQTRYDCILMDVHMPLMDGIEASRHIAELPEPLNQVPIIALTANVIANEERALKEAGVQATLFKPINEQQVIHHIRKAANISSDELPQSKPPNKPRLADYGISESALHLELNKQMEAIYDAFLDHDITMMRDHSHQLMGLAGLLDLVELEAATITLNQAVKHGVWRTIWLHLWRLQRVIRGIEL